MIDLPEKLLGRGFDYLSDMADRTLDLHVRLAVTGLRRSGKTVFTTALVHHLIDPVDLPFLKAVHEHRFRGAKILKRHRGRPFPFERYQDELSRSNPIWPQHTQNLTTLDLELAFKTRQRLWRQVRTDWHMRLEVIDYPGEWLLDLAMLGQSFAAFCETNLGLLEAPSRRHMAAEWLSSLERLDPKSAADPNALEDCVSAYQRYAMRCQSELGLSFIQPGRLTSPGDLKDIEILRFCPIPEELRGENWIDSELAYRFARYRDRVVKPFYDNHFRHFDRQIVLIDLLSDLNAGPDHFQDTKRAIAQILSTFKYGRVNLLDRLFSPAIDKVVFAVSKADHVAVNQHANLKQLLELLVKPTTRELRFHGLDFDVLPIAALKCTDTVNTEHHGQVLSCVRGRLKDEEREIVLFPGEVPPDLPEDQDWNSGRFQFKSFAPRPLREGRRNQHIRLDQAIESLIGDKLD